MDSVEAVDGILGHIAVGVLKEAEALRHTSLLILDQVESFKGRVRRQEFLHLLLGEFIPKRRTKQRLEIPPTRLSPEASDLLHIQYREEEILVPVGSQHETASFSEKNTHQIATTAIITGTKELMMPNIK